MSKRTLSREYLEEALREAKKQLPVWAYAMIHQLALARSGGRARHRKQEPTTEVQTLIFDKETFPTRAGATKWARDHDFSASKVDETSQSWRLRQRDPGDFVSGSFRTIEITAGVKSVIGRLKPALRKSFPNEVAEVGIHVHTIDRLGKTTQNDGAHRHLFVLPDGTQIVTEEDGPHTHPMGDEADDLIIISGTHRHRILLADGSEMMTEEGGEHTHQLQVSYSAFDGIHTHELKLSEGQVIESLWAGEFWQLIGKPRQDTLTEAPPASDLARLSISGPDGAKLALIGSQPSDIEKIRGELFVGPVGKTLRDVYLAPLGLTKEDVILGNINGNPTGLIMDLDRKKPQIVIALGSAAKKDLGDRAAFVLPHPNVINKYGDRGEVARKLRQINKALKAPGDEGEPVEKWLDDWHRILPSTGKGQFVCERDWFVENGCPAEISLERENGSWLNFSTGVTFKLMEVRKSMVEGNYELGVVQKDSIELFLDGTGISGKYLLTFAKVDDQGRTSWLINKPEDQTPIADQGEKKLADTLRELKKKRHKFLLWGKPGQRLQKYDVETRKAIKELIAPILKADEEKQIIYSVVLDPYIVDAHGDWISPGEVEDTAHKWFKESRVIGRDHRKQADAQVVENTLVQYPPGEYRKAIRGEAHRAYEMPFGDDVVHSGAWILGVQLGDGEWAAFKRGEIGAYSIGGFGHRSEIQPSTMPDVTFIDLTP